MFIHIEKETKAAAMRVGDASERGEESKEDKAIFQKNLMELEMMLRVVNHFMVQRYVHMEVEPSTIEVIQNRLNELEPR